MLVGALRGVGYTQHRQHWGSFPFRFSRISPPTPLGRERAAGAPSQGVGRGVQTARRCWRELPGAVLRRSSPGSPSPCRGSAPPAQAVTEPPDPVCVNSQLCFRR